VRQSLLATLAAERDEAVRAARETGFSARAFGVYWRLRGDEVLRAEGIEPAKLAPDADSLFARFPNASVDAEERRALRAALYRPLLPLPQEERGRIIDAMLPVLLDDADALD
jgi:type I restriction enzyme R subunit